MPTDLSGMIDTNNVNAIREARTKELEARLEKSVPFSKTAASSIVIDHPSRDPDYDRAVKIGKKRLAKMKFESEAQKRDYLRDISRNEMNIPGLPEFYPPRVLRSTGFGDGKLPQLSCGHKAIRSLTKIDGQTGEAVTTLRCGYGHVEERKGL